MSIVHHIVYRQMMKSKVLYSAEHKSDYKEERKKERLLAERVPLPRNVKIKEDKLGNILVEYVTKKENPEDRILFYIHGGGFVLGEPKTRRAFTIYLADKMGYNVVAVNYRLAPEAPFPAGSSDCLQAYEEILKQYDAEKILFVGESAGGNLVLSTLLQAKEKNLPLPAAVFAIAPTLQYDQEFPSYTENLNTDCMVGYLSEEVCDEYLQSREEEVLHNPIAAPYYGDYAGCPPIYLWVSSSEVLRDDSIFLYEKLKKEKQPCNLYIRKNMLHTYITIPIIPEAKKDLKIMKQLVDDAMKGRASRENKWVDLK